MIHRLRASWAAFYRHHQLADGTLAGSLAALSVANLWVTHSMAPDRFATPDPLAVGMTLLQTLPLTFRRRWPMLIYAVIGVSTVVYAQTGYPVTVASLGVLIALYTVAAHLPLVDATIAALIYVGGLTLSLVGAWRVLGGPLAGFLLDWFVNLLILVLAFIVGVSLRTWRAYVGELEARTALLEREREENAQLAIALERGRIGRELHDVIAHSISVMVVQAGAAERLVEQDAPRAKQALSTIVGTGREALAEMRRMVAGMRDEDDQGALMPQPGLAHLESLASRMRAAGLPVEVSQQGDPRPLPAIVDLSAYRIVQEALTNSLKHAGAARARVIVRYQPDALELQVTDNGRGAEDGNGALGPEGHGLIGMRERVALFDGELQAGPRPEGGYAVLARIPLRDGPDDVHGDGPGEGDR